MTDGWTDESMKSSSPIFNSRMNKGGSQVFWFLGVASGDIKKACKARHDNKAFYSKFEIHPTREEVSKVSVTLLLYLQF